MQDCHRQQLGHCTGIAKDAGSFLSPSNTALLFAFPHLLRAADRIRPKTEFLFDTESCNLMYRAAAVGTETPALSHLGFSPGF